MLLGNLFSKVKISKWYGGLLILPLLSSCMQEFPGLEVISVNQINTSEINNLKEVAKPSVNPVYVGEFYSIEDAIGNSKRKKKNVKRDRYRSPKATLDFLGVSPRKTVVEIWPGGGWYTEILAPYVTKNGGVYIAAGFEPSETGFYQKSRTAFTEEFLNQPEKWGRIYDSYFGKNGSNFAANGQVDVILTFRNVHNWMKAGFQEKAFKDFYDGLRPGGILGVVEHRENPDSTDDLVSKSGYVKQDYIINLALEAGFEFVASSEINANIKDTKDHPNGVWTLPPVSRVGDKDKEAAKYLNIGESDRMTLKFRKPNNL